MSHYYYGSQHHQSSSSVHSSTSSHGHHGGRSRRAPRLSSSQNSHRQFRGVRSMKELTGSPPVSAFRARFEAGRSFDLDDDLEFCPGLLTEDDVRLASSGVRTDIEQMGSPFIDQGADLKFTSQLQSIHSSSSDGSLSSGSPQSSPLQHQVQPTPQPTPAFSLPSTSSNSYNPVAGLQSNNNQNQVKILQPSALRPRKLIPIVNPTTGKSLTSPPPSISPAMMQQRAYGQHW